MSLSSDGTVMTMPVQPANTSNGNGWGFGGDGAWWIIILFLFVFCGWGGNWGNNGFGGNGSTGAVSTMCGGITAAMTGAIRLLSVWKILCAEQTAKIVNQSNAALT